MLFFVVDSLLGTDDVISNREFSNFILEVIVGISTVCIYIKVGSARARAHVGNGETDRSVNITERTPNGVVAALHDPPTLMGGKNNRQTTGRQHGSVAAAKVARTIGTTRALGSHVYVSQARSAM